MSHRFLPGSDSHADLANHAANFRFVPASPSWLWAAVACVILGLWHLALNHTADFNGGRQFLHRSRRSLLSDFAFAFNLNRQGGPGLRLAPMWLRHCTPLQNFTLLIQIISFNKRFV
ncbi:hypothetical protein LXL04_016565 [Taraxacum kok-saghyz]